MNVLVLNMLGKSATAEPHPCAPSIITNNRMWGVWVTLSDGVGGLGGLGSLWLSHRGT